MVRPTSAADISSRPVAASPAALMRDLDLLLRLSGRIVKGCRLPGSLALLACENGPGRAGAASAERLHFRYGEGNSRCARLGAICDQSLRGGQTRRDRV